MRRLLDELIGLAPGEQPDGAWVPPLDVRDPADELVLCLDLPGVRQEEISVELDEAGVCADYRDGVLEVHVPKAPERRLRRIDVSSAE